MRFPASLRDHCRTILEDGSLEAKLASPPGGAAGLDDSLPGEELDVAVPARAPEIQPSEHAGPLPRPGALADTRARARCLARFAHHELMAVELFAWGLLRWPALDPELRRDFARVLDEEQLHCRLYLERLAEHGGRLSQHALSG